MKANKKTWEAKELVLVVMDLEKMSLEAIKMRLKSRLGKIQNLVLLTCIREIV